MLNVPEHTPYDLHFRLFGFSVRVTWTFWLMGAVLGWGWSQGLDNFAVRANMDSPGAAGLLLIWIACVFLTILVHEMGHAVAWRIYGQDAEIVLYHFGGLAVNRSMTAWDGAKRHRTTPMEQLIVSAAGPGAQLLLAFVVWIVGLWLRMPMEATVWANQLGGDLPLGQMPGTVASYAFFDAILWTSIFWAILNLAPIFPLDGGQILHNVMLMTNVNRPQYTAYMISAVAGGLLGIYFLSTGQPMAGLMFLMLAASNWQQAQSSGGLF
jgi:stage IV sporulation protein FB